MSDSTVEHDQMEYDYCVVGAGPAGLACALRLKQLKPDKSVCVLEKASALGAQSISGAVMEPGPLEQLLPNWRRDYTGMKVPAAQDDVRLMTRTGSLRLPDWMVRLSPLNNHGNFIVSLGQLVPWLGTQAEAAGVDIFPGFAAAEPLYSPEGSVKGVRIGDMGVNRDGSQGPNFAPGADIVAATTVLAEGARGSITKQLIARFKLDQGKDPPTFGLGFKELWQLPPGRVTPGRIEHSFGWPLDPNTYGGSFLYHLDNDRIYIGYVVGLNYQDPRLSPFETFQQFKHHPRIKPLLEGGEILAAGARSIAAGGYQSLPALEMPGAILIGDAGGTLNVFKIKGIHQAIRSGVLAAEHLADTGRKRRASTRAGAPRKVIANCARCAISSRDSSAACMWPWRMRVWKLSRAAIRPGRSTIRPMPRRCGNSMTTPRPTAAGSRARCRLATACPRYSSPAMRTTRTSPFICMSPMFRSAPIAARKSSAIPARISARRPSMK